MSCLLVDSFIFLILNKKYDIFILTRITFNNNNSFVFKCFPLFHKS